jgi:hypothetical protein
MRDKEIPVVRILFAPKRRYPLSLQGSLSSLLSRKVVDGHSGDYLEEGNTVHRQSEVSFRLSNELLDIYLLRESPYTVRHRPSAHMGKTLR